ncbi:MAG: C25 family cysteine peptidase [Bacteroidota bacterium]
MVSILAVLLLNGTFGQFGNEWINFDQTYFKFKVARNDFYRITREELLAAGFPVSSVPANRIQLFREGKEVAINVGINTANTIEYLEFYGLRRDGSSDTPLYDSGNQPHTYYNLFSDSASYFLTYKLVNENGKRMGFSSDRNTTGLAPEQYHLADTLTIFSNDYSGGVQLSHARTLSDYNRGEGWTGRAFSKGQSRTFEYLLEGPIINARVVFETVLFGRNGLDHNTNFSVGPNATNLTSIGNTQFSLRDSHFYTNMVPNSSIGNNGELFIQILEEGFPDASTRISVAYLRLVYGQEINMFNHSNKVFTLDNVSERKGWLQIGTSNAPEIRAFDVTDPFHVVQLNTTPFSDRLEVVVSNVSVSNKILAVSSPASIGSISEIVIPAYNLNRKNYLIVTHPGLRGGQDQIEAYQSYRESEAGGNYSVQIANINELYDLFSFGDPTPLAVSNFVRFANASSPVQFVFIIGKGLTTNFNSYRGNQTTLNIPTYGLPGTDALYVRGIGPDPEIPGIPIGRLTATEPPQVTAYLDKVKEMEALPFDDLFRKDFLQLSGGLTQSEINHFATIIQSLASIAEDDFVGGRTFNTGKETNATVEFINITDQVNEGVGYITFFGHSSGSVADIEVGRPSDPSFGFSNKGKYPIFLVNGCDAGGIFTTGPLTYGEDWVLAPNLGAINFIAHTDIALSSTLRKWSNLFYTIGFTDDNFIGKSVGEVMVEASRQYWERDQSDGDLTQIQQTQLQGDPAYRIFGADFPDYEVNQNSITPKALEGNEILSSQDSFTLEIVIRNFGRSVSDSLMVQVNRTLPDGDQETYLDKFIRPLRQDTLFFTIPFDPLLRNEGLNVFSVFLDPLNEQQELNENNNTSTIELAVFSGNTFNLFPIENGIINLNEVEFLWQSSSLLENSRSYDLEFDTRPDFNGTNKRSFTVDGEVLLKESFDFSSLSLSDTSVIYWRTRFANPGPEESDRWVENSFTLINHSGNGWGQYAATQFETGNVSGIIYNEDTDRWEFQSSTTPIDFFTFGADNDALSIEDLKVMVDGVNLLITSFTEEITCINNTFNIVVFDKETGAPYYPILIPVQDVLSTAVCGRRPQRIYQFRDSLLKSLDSRLDGISFTSVVNAMRQGDQVVMFNIGNVNFSEWEPEVITLMNSLGISTSTISSLVDGQPVILFGRKGGEPGSATIVTGNGSLDPITEQSAALSDNVIASFTSGKINTTRIGPANTWESLDYHLTEEIDDTFTLELSGVASNGQVDVLFTRTWAETLAIGSIDPNQYPQLELSFSFSDETDETPPQLSYWQVNYSLPAEGMLLPGNKEEITLFEGEEISKSFNLINISKEDFADSLSVMATLVNQNTGNISETSFKIPPPVSGDTTVFDVAFKSFNMTGFNSIVVEVSANENEVYDLNNRLTLSNGVEVKADETNPIIDVTFDGFHILDGDIVSPNPVISVRMRDDSPFLFKEDTVGFNLSLKLPGETSQFQRINFSDSRLEYFPASESQDFEIEFRPGPLEDGMHGLRILAEDESSNAIKEIDDPYEINFEVINESAVTHFYPYPNPFSTSCRFVFTLTGSEIPDQLKIQIMTVSGRVVREITQYEIGPIRIGNNITSYAWDGRDEYGDQLANGVYFYKVFLKSNQEDLSHRTTSADKAFKNGFGKLYILR